jgi:hypothetical protein
MIYFKSALIGIGTVLLGCVATPIAMLIWASWKTESGIMTVGFSPMALVHSVGFWAFIILLFAAGFIPSVFFLRR